MTDPTSAQDNQSGARMATYEDSTGQQVQIDLNDPNAQSRVASEGLRFVSGPEDSPGRDSSQGGRR